ncbi:MAG: transglycosylase SLT domain-containing protein [Proteobacteria bacterium]|nr:transglycosylase SLT domain-containing protein [Pseudomonadota bacterium]
MRAPLRTLPRIHSHARPWTILAAVAALCVAACATPPTGPATPGAGDGSAPPVVAAPVAAPVIALPKPLPMPPFPPAEMAELEPLPFPKPDLWDRIAEGYSVPDLPEDDPLVVKWEHYYASRPDYMARSVERSRRYLYHIVTTIEARKMPLDLALLPMVESAYNPTALSTSRASGIWQFVPSTGKLFGLEQNFWFDSRRDIVAATNSALDYLQKLYDQFGDWQLALAAYNWGEGNVAKAIARNQAKGLPTDYASLRMPDETRNYVPKFQAIKNIVADPDKFGVTLADIPDTPYFTVVKVNRKMDVKLAADLAEMPLDEFLLLNPQHNRPVIAGADEYTILLPFDKAEMFAAKLELTDQPLVTWQAYRLKPHETMAQVAARYGMSEETLRAVNGIGSRARVPDNHALLVPAERPSEATAQTLVATVFTTVPQGRTVYYTVRRGDTLQRVAAHYGVSVRDVREWNGMTQSQLRAGQKLRIVVDRGSANAHAEQRRAAKGGRTQSAKATKAPAKSAASPARTTTTAKRSAPKPKATASRAPQAKSAAAKPKAGSAKSAAKKPGTAQASAGGADGS